MMKLILDCRIKIDVFNDIVSNTQNLQCLILDYKPNPFPRDYMRLIFLNLKNLKELTIKACGTIDSNPYKVARINISNLTNLRRTTFKDLGICPEISLYYLSRAVNLTSVYFYLTGKVIKILNTTPIRKV